MERTSFEFNDAHPVSNLIFLGILIVVLITAAAPVRAQIPPNDLCVNAITLDCATGPFSDLGDNTNSSSTEAPFCSTNPGSTAVWYTITGNGFDITVDTCSPETVFDTKINVYTGDCADETALVCVAGNDDAAGSPPECSLGGLNRLSRVSWTSVDGEEYLIVVSGFGGNAGAFEIQLDCEVPVELQRVTVE